jgi:signal transduction histidine kinase
MGTDVGHLTEERLLVLAPTGRDAMVTRQVLSRAGIVVEVCANMADLCARLTEGAGAALLAEEALTAAAMRTLGRALASQPPWSDLPILVSTATGEMTDARARAISALSGNVTILERPVRVFSMLVSVQAMLSARRRQYQMRDLHLELQRQMDRLQTERDLRARFVSLLAHDLRGPISGAMLAADSIVRSPQKLDERRDLGLRVKRNLDRIERMVHDLLDASRIQAGQPLLLRIAECDLGMVAAEVVEELNSLHGDRIVFDAEPNIRGFWSADELRRATWNLATNAIKYGSSDTPVSVSVTSVDGRARLAVHNRGQPILPDDQRRIFEPFARSHTSKAEKQLGWGLGLTLVRGCAEAHGGNVEIDSSAEHGTTFIINVPLDARAVQNALEQEALSP